MNLDPKPEEAARVLPPALATAGCGVGGGTATTPEPMPDPAIDGTAADAARAWRGSLPDNGADDVPKVATGWFYSTYGRAGKIFGGFGANKR